MSTDAVSSAEDSDQYLIVQLGGPANSTELESLFARVDQVYGYLPQDSFLVRVAPGEKPSLGAWTGVYRPEYKVARSVRDMEDWAALAGEATATVMVQAYPDADLERIAGEVAALGEAELVGMGTGGRFSRIRLRVPADRAVAVADAMAALPEVVWIDVEGQRALFNDTTTWVGQAGLGVGQITPIFDRGIHGEGQVVGLIDTGADVDSCFLRDTARGLPPQNLCDGGTVVDPSQRKVIAVDFLWTAECEGGITAAEWDTNGHGTPIAGTLAGDNFARPIVHDTADGMAPGAKLVIQDAGAGTDNCGSMPGIGCPVVDLKPFFQQAYSQGARLHSNSWGDEQNAFPHNKYTAASEDVDDFMWTHPDFLIFFAAGNAGSNPGTVFSPGTAKNAISVGATVRGNNAETMATFSGCGPTADNRIKPDLTIPGTSIVSARGDNNVGSNNCTTVATSGTSMATPAAAGFGALVRQYYADGFYPSGTAKPADAFAPSAALVKATLLNSAKQMTSAAAGTIPGNCQGWGRILLENALFFPGQPRRLFAADDPGFPQGGAGQEKTFFFHVRENESLKATLVWTDFPSTPAASINLVNDLDLEVSGPPGTFLGNVFSGGLSQQGGAADRRNTVEQVLLARPGAGTYQVTVRAFNVPVGPQPFALILSGDAVRNEPPIADAGPDQVGQIGARIVLDGSASSDPDAAPSALSFKWTQIAGPAVQLEGADTAVASFTPAELGTYEFRMAVSDGAEERSDTVVATIVNQPPVAVAGPDRAGQIATPVQLDGSASSDPDGVPSPLSFSWIQTGGPAVTLDGADKAVAGFLPAALGAHTFLLVVSDGEAEAEDTVVVDILNQPPIANAGADQTGTIGTEVALDGSGSTDPDKVPAPLSFSWKQVAGPEVSLAGADAAVASLKPIALGTYTFSLVVSDGAAEAEDTVVVTIVNRPPAADAGPDQEGAIGVEVLLDGAGSSDPDGVPSPLSFAWTQTGGPAQVELLGAGSSLATFIPAALGTYTFRLVVGDGEAEAEDSVAVTVLNLPPVANAGPDGTGLVGFPVLLDGSGSRDPDGVPAPLSFSWTQTDGPAVTLAGADTALATFVPPALGTYTFRLAVGDGAAENADAVVVTILNQPPVADAGADRTGFAGLPIALSGAGSRDPDGGPSPLTFAWTQIDGPPVTLAGADAVEAVFTPAALGTYTFRLAVGDGAAEAADTVEVTIVNRAPIASAGPDRTGNVGEQIFLDGTGSSDPDGLPSPLTFSWNQTGGPAAALAGGGTPLASFAAPALGTYTFRLVVSDGAAEADATVSVTIANLPPVASAGPDLTGLVGAQILLDGAGSSDPDGGPSPLSFSWSQIEGPDAALSADGAQASVTAAALGTHTFRLVVSDGAAQAEDTVAVTILNQGPTADAGPDQTGFIGLPVILVGTGSIDPDGLPLPLSFSWTQIGGPPAVLSGGAVGQATFIPTALGTYTFQLLVGDGSSEDEDTVVVTVFNQAPVANAGLDFAGLAGAVVPLDGTASVDPDAAPSPLSYAWTQIAGPQVAIAGASSAAASFTPPSSGTYTFELLVSDGAAQDDDTVTVTVPALSSVIFADDFEQDRGWTANPSGTDTATTGAWERANPEDTDNVGTPMQLGTTPSGSFDLVTVAAAGGSVGANDIDGGATSIRSPAIALPAGKLTLSFAYYLAHLSNASSADFLRVSVVGLTSLTVVEQLGVPTDVPGSWKTTSVDITAFAGQTVRILIEAADAPGGSLVEAAVDDVKVEALL